MKPFIKTFLLKVAARCNINCDYCYEYNLADQSWKNKPARMSMEVLDQTIYRMEEHIKEHSIKHASIIFHGGEPLMAGKDFFRQAVAKINKRFENICFVRYGMQSNGILLDETWAKMLKELKIGVGISIDGYKELNDKHRLDRKGRSTFKKTEKAIQIISQPQYNEVRGGLLCVMQVDTDPIKLFKWFMDCGKNQIDFLFPHYNHERKPPHPFSEKEGYGYGKWLSKIFDYWWFNDVSEIKIRVFEDLMHLMLGGKYAVESFGLSPVQLAVVQSDGAYEAVDSLKSTFDGAVTTSKNVFSSSFNDIFSDYLISSRVERFKNLSTECQKCRLVKVCGGGYLPHRFHPDVGFDAPSIYCADLMFLIEHIENRISANLNEEYKMRLTFALTNKGTIDCLLY